MDDLPESGSESQEVFTSGTGVFSQFELTKLVRVDGAVVAPDVVVVSDLVGWLT